MILSPSHKKKKQRSPGLDRKNMAVTLNEALHYIFSQIHSVRRSTCSNLNGNWFLETKKKLHKLNIIVIRARRLSPRYYCC